MAKKMPDIGDYKYGFHDKDVSIFRSERGLTEEIVREISNMKEEPQSEFVIVDLIALLLNSDGSLLANSQRYKKLQYIQVCGFDIASNRHVPKRLSLK